MRFPRLFIFVGRCHKPVPFFDPWPVETLQHNEVVAVLGDAPDHGQVQDFKRVISS